jgi:hypothetical protein
VPFTATVCAGQRRHAEAARAGAVGGEVIVAVPLRTPALAVSMPTTRLELLLACGPSR